MQKKIVTDYIDWRDFYEFPAKARTWDENQAIGKRVYMSKQECIERFGEEIGREMRPDTTPLDSKNDRVNVTDTTIFQDINERAIVVYEIWNKSDQRVYWVSPGYDYLCDVREDPYKLDKFFPVPEPLSSTLTNDSNIPVPDFMEWQDQAIQIDELTQRIAMLTKACKIAGAYDASNKALSRILEETTENQLIPVDQWAFFADKGGMVGAISFLPLKDIQDCINTLQTVRQQCMIDLDQITGISDVVRGTTDSRETLGGIRLKNNNAGTRLSESQEDVARFARDAIAIIAELICKHFSDETLIEASGILFEEELQPDVVLNEYESITKPATPPQQSAAPKPMGVAPGAPGGGPMATGAPPAGANVVPFPGGQPPQTLAPAPSMMPGMMGGQMPMMAPPPPDPQVLIMHKIDKAINLLREDVTRNYRIDIETDSTIFGDKEQERASATEFVGAVGQFFGQFEGIVQSVPEAMPLFGSMLQWAVRKYRTGRDLESQIDAFVVKMDKKAKMMAENPPPNPEQQKAQAEIQKMGMQADMQAKNDQRAADLQMQNDQRDAQREERDDQRKFQMEQAQDQREKEKMQMEARIAQLEADLRMRELEMQRQMAEAKHHQEMQKLHMTAHVNAKENEADLDMQEKEFDLKKQEHAHDKKEETHKHKLKMKEKSSQAAKKKSA